MINSNNILVVLDVWDERDRLLTRIELSPFTSHDVIFLKKETKGTSTPGAAQLIESSTYEYQVADPGFHIRQLPGVISSSAFREGARDRGTIQTGLFVGTLPLIVDNSDGKPAGTTNIEVRSRKLNYETEYRSMLEDIADWCADLMSDLRGATANRFIPDPGKDWNTIQERFFVLRGIIDSRDFENALHRILAYPYTFLENKQEDTDLRKGIKWTGSVSRQFSSSNRRVPLPNNHPLRRNVGIVSVPTHIIVGQRIETVDTPANQFVKFALEAFESFLTDMAVRLKGLSKKKDEPYLKARDRVLIDSVENAREKISEFLSHSLFQEASTLRSIPVGNPVLQRKAGYREILLAWLKFQMASQLVWEGGDDVFFGAQKNVATLYEYWVFFKLLDSFKAVAQVDDTFLDALFEKTADGVSIKLKAGRMLGPIRGVAQGLGRQFIVELSYNKSFSYSPQWSKEGSWTRRLRPDYTFEIWPSCLGKNVAESSGVLARIHFDAKYRAHISELIGEETDEDDGSSNSARIYVREDLLKMHAYRDAIRRTEGAYIIYPGNDETKFYQFEELLPGLGAFALRPGLNESGALVIKDFLNDIINHLSDRVSIRERKTHAEAKVLSSGKMDPIFADLPDFVNLKDGNDKVTPPANEMLILLVRQDTKEAAEWTAIQKKIILFFNTGVHTQPLLEKITGVDIVVILHPSENGDTYREYIPGSFSFLSHEELQKSGFPIKSEVNTVILALEVLDDGKDRAVIPQSMLECGFEKMSDSISAYSLAELFELIRNVDPVFEKQDEKDR